MRPLRHDPSGPSCESDGAPYVLSCALSIGDDRDGFCASKSDVWISHLVARPRDCGARRADQLPAAELGGI